MGFVYPLERDDHGRDMNGQRPRRPSRRTLLTYLAAWLAVGAAIALVAVALLTAGTAEPGEREPDAIALLLVLAHVADDNLHCDSVG